MKIKIDVLNEINKKKQEKMQAKAAIEKEIEELESSMKSLKNCKGIVWIEIVGFDIFGCGYLRKRYVEKCKHLDADTLKCTAVDDDKYCKKLKCKIKEMSEHAELTCKFEEYRKKLNELVDKKRLLVKENEHV